MHFNCKYCNYSTDNCQNYKRHLLTKKHINNDINIISNTIPKDTETSTQLLIYKDNNDISYYTVVAGIYLCLYCNKKFKSNKHIKIHCINSCINIPTSTKNKLITKHNADKRTKQYLNIVDKNSQPIKTPTQNINYGTLTNNIFNVNFNAVGKENLSNITQEERTAILSSGKHIMKEYLNYVYKNRDNINTLINIRTKTLTFINSNMDLETGDLNDYLDTLVDTHFDNINKLFYECKPMLSESVRRSFYKIWEGVYNTYYYDNEEDHNIDGLDFKNPFTHIKLFNSFMSHIQLKLLDVKYIAKDKLDKFLKIKLHENKEHVIIGV